MNLLFALFLLLLPHFSTRAHVGDLTQTQENYSPTPAKNTKAKHERGTTQPMQNRNRRKLKKKSMRFIVLWGSFFPKENKFEEAARFSVEVIGKNPTINEILEKVKQAYHGPEGTKDYLSLALPEPNYEDLETEKTVADYKIKDGAILWVMLSLR